MPPSPAYRPAPVFPTLGDGFADVVAAARFPRHQLRYRNQRWAARVGLDTLDDAEWEAHFARFVPLPQNLPAPLALRYHGHQFMTYNPHLGDGRGFLFAQLRDDAGRLLDLGTKGSGETPWSRGGDGRLTLKGGVREVLATEMLEALGVYSSKSFSLVETGEELERGDEPSPTRSSVLVRLGHSHVRFGSFQRHAHARDAARVSRLLDFAVEHYAPAAAAAENVPAAFLREVVARSARLCASWMAAGFVHGVLNTDNLNVTGESFDYGPYRFLPTFDPTFTAAYFDHHGLYAYGRQPRQVHWNLARLAEALALVSPVAALVSELERFPAAHAEALAAALLRRLGLASRGPDEDTHLVETAFAFLGESRLPFEQLFFDWFGGTASAARAAASPAAAAYDAPGFASLRRLLEAHAPADAGRLGHPYFQRARPCTLLIDEIEGLWARIAEADDWAAFWVKLRAIAEMRAGYGLARP